MSNTLPLQNATHDEVDISGYITELFNSWRVIALFGAIAVALTVAFALFVAQPAFIAKAKLLVETKGRIVQGGAIIVEQYPIEDVGMSAELARISSYQVFRPVIIDFDIVNDAEFMLPAPASSTEEEKFRLAHQGLLAHFKVNNPRNTNLIDLRLTSSDKDKALALLDAIVASYLKAQSKSFFETYTSTADTAQSDKGDPAWVNRELNSIKSDVERIQNAGENTDIDTIQRLEDISVRTATIAGYYLSTFEVTRNEEGYELLDTQFFSDVIGAPSIENPLEDVWSIRVLALNIILGLLAGMFFVIGRSIMRGRPCTPGFLENQHRLSVMKATGHKPTDRLKNMAQTLRDQMVFEDGQDGANRILVLNAPGRAGKVRLGEELAACFVAAGKTALLISSTGDKAVEGPANAEAFTNSISQASAGYDVLAIAKNASDARDIYPSAAFAGFYAEICGRYDLVVFTGEPEGDATAVLSLHRLVDRVVLKCDAKRTFEKGFLDLQRQLKLDRNKLVCVYP